MRTSRVQLGGALRSLSALLDYCNALAPILSSIIVNSHDDDDNDDDGDGDGGGGGGGDGDGDGDSDDNGGGIAGSYLSVQSATIRVQCTLRRRRVIITSDTQGQHSVQIYVCC